MIQRSLAKKRSGEGGFTLIELLIVIVILGILAAIVVLAIGGLKDSSQTASCNSEVKTLSTAQDAYFASHDTTYSPDGHTLFTAGLLKDDPSVAPVHFDVAGSDTGYSITKTAGGACDLGGVQNYTYGTP
jgi:general secretion pathway protein G